MRSTAYFTLLAACLALAAPLSAAGADSARSAVNDKVGHPSVKLDELVVPEGFPAALERHLKFVLRRAARRADWGAGHGAHIQFRFVVRDFTVTREGDVVRISCNALGKLPGGVHATSRLSFGGAPREADALSKRVLEVVARGVVQRLADLERQRRATKSE